MRLFQVLEVHRHLCRRPNSRSSKVSQLVVGADNTKQRIKSRARETVDIRMGQHMRRLPDLGNGLLQGHALNRFGPLFISIWHHNEASGY